MTDKDLERYAAQAAIPLLYVQSRLSDFGPDVQAAVAENATVDFFLHGPPGQRQDATECGNPLAEHSGRLCLARG